MNLINRQELQTLRSEALDLAGVKGTSPSWVRVYLRLADAASELDAYMAHTEVSVCPNACVQPANGCSSCPEN